MSRTGWLLTTTAIATQPLTQVSITSPSNGQVLIYDSANTRWINGSSIDSGYTIATQTIISQASSPFVLTTAAILTKHVILTYTGGATLFAAVSTPTASAIITALGLTSNDLCFDFSLIVANWTGSGGIAAWTAGTGVTITGSIVINLPGSGLFRIRRTSATTVTIYTLCNKG